MDRGLVYDVGMHKGEDSAFYLAKGYRVVGFEANPELAAHCRERFAGEDRCTVVGGAITESGEGSVRFYCHPNSVWGTTEIERVERNMHAGESKPVDVPAIDFAEQLRESGVPTYLKIDIEGADRHCLETLREFKERPKYVSIEASHTDRAAASSELSLLEELGYNRFAVVQQATIPGDEIETQTLDGAPLRYRFEDDSSGPFGEDLSGWVDRAAAEKHYGRIARTYRVIRRPEELLLKSQIGKGVRGQALRLLGPMPGWFDTHAAR